MNREKRDMLVFGYGLGLIAAFFGVGGYLKHGMTLAQIVLLTCSVFLVCATSLDWTALRPAYKGWMKAAHAIGSVVTTLVLVLVFVICFVPVGVVLKIIGKDHLDRRWDRAASSYWCKRPQDEFSKDRYSQQF